MIASQLEIQLRGQGYGWIAGVDEAGRGPLAGPVVAAAVVLPDCLDCRPWLDVQDSKALTGAKREALYGLIRSSSTACSVAVGSSSMIDRRNILNATLEIMSTAVRRLRVSPDIVLVDGNRTISCKQECRCVVGGDRYVLSVAAASILAKVVRDRIMSVYAKRFPVYGFEKHRGYPTLEHRRALHRHGPCPIHRRSFRLAPQARAR